MLLHIKIVRVVLHREAASVTRGVQIWIRLAKHPQKDFGLQVYDITDKHTLQQVRSWVKELQAMVSQRPSQAASLLCGPLPLLSTEDQ